MKNPETDGSLSIFANGGGTMSGAQKIFVHESTLSFALTDEEKLARIDDLKKRLEDASSIILVTHINPDADAIASVAIFVWKMLPNWRDLPGTKLSFVGIPHNSRREADGKRLYDYYPAEGEIVIHFDIGDEYEFGVCYDHHHFKYAKDELEVWSATRLVHHDFWFPGEDPDVDVLSEVVNARDNNRRVDISEEQFYRMSLLWRMSEYLSGQTHLARENNWSQNDIYRMGIDYLDGWRCHRRLHRECERIITDDSKIFDTPAGQVLVSAKILVDTGLFRNHLKLGYPNVRVIVGRYIATDDRVMVITFPYNETRRIINVSDLISNLQKMDPQARIWCPSGSMFAVYVKQTTCLTVASVAQEVGRLIFAKTEEFDALYKKPESKLTIADAQARIMAEPNPTKRRELIEALLPQLSDSDKLELLTQFALLASHDTDESHSETD